MKSCFFVANREKGGIRYQQEEGVDSNFSVVSWGRGHLSQRKGEWNLVRGEEIHQVLSEQTRVEVVRQVVKEAVLLPQGTAVFLRHKGRIYPHHRIGERPVL
jgi:hypothetical protein